MREWAFTWFRRLKSVFAYSARDDPWAEAIGRMDHFRAILDPFRDYKVVLIGDSKTWGLYASGIAESRPRRGSLSDPRNNFSSPTWANLFALNVGQMFTDSGEPGAPVRNWPGTLGWSKLIHVDPVRESRVRLYSKTGKLLKKKEGTVVGSVFNKTLKIGPGQYVEFLTESYNLDLIYTAAPYDEHARFSVKFNDNRPIITNFFSPSFTAGRVLPLKWAPNRRKVIVTNLGERTLHLEAIRRTKHVRIANQGLIGTAPSQWVPDGPLLKNAIRKDDTHAIVALGTNGRYGSIESNKEYLRSIVLHLRQCGIDPLVAADSAIRADKEYPNLPRAKFGLSSVHAMVKDLSEEENFDWIDWFTPTIQHLDNGRALHVRDGVHENDLGHNIKFNVLWQTLGGTISTTPELELAANRQ